VYHHPAIGYSTKIWLWTNWNAERQLSSFLGLLSSQGTIVICWEPWHGMSPALSAQSPCLVTYPGFNQMRSGATSPVGVPLTIEKQPKGEIVSFLSERVLTLQFPPTQGVLQKA